MSTSTSLDILISGAGVTGPILAHFLQKSSHNHTITVVERAPAPRLTGQSVDVRVNGLKIIQQMGSHVESAIRSKVSHERGFRFIDAQDRIWGEFPVHEGRGLTSDLEIMRGDLATILYDATKELERVEYVFGDYIANMDQDLDGVRVAFANGRPSHKYDLVIGADGWASKTRHMAFGEAAEDSIKSLGQYTAYFKIPYAKEDGTWALWHNMPGGRLFLVRPDPANNVTRVWMSSMSQTDVLEHALTLNIDEQKEVLTKMFTGAGWRSERFLRDMQPADDFYFQKIAQVKLDTWSTGRVVLVGDAAYAPSPISGKGTDVAMTGAYILAGEINLHANDCKAAFKAYEDKMRDYVTRSQKLFPGTPGLANPQTWWGITILNTFLWLATITGLNKIVVGPLTTTLDLPDYA